MRISRELEIEIWHARKMSLICHSLERLIAAVAKFELNPVKYLLMVATMALLELT
jgi:hypothetical protein